MSNATTVKLTPRKLARIIAECACEEMASPSQQDSGQPMPTPSQTPSQGSVDAGLFPGMGDTPALSDTGNGGCGDSNVVSQKPEAPIDVVAEPDPAAMETEPMHMEKPEGTDDPDSVELVIGSI